MPRFNGTGPLRIWERTGRGFGPCGMGMGYRRGFGYGRWFTTKNEEKEMLQEEIEELKKEMEGAQEKLQELEGQK